jgi:hypothetical protein
VLLDHLLLDLKSHGGQSCQVRQDVESGAAAIVEPPDSRSFALHISPPVRPGQQLALSILPDGLIRELIPEGGYEDDVLECIVTTQTAEHGEIPHDGIGHTLVLDAVQVYDAAQFEVVFVRRAQGLRDVGQDISVAAIRVVEARRVEEDELSVADEALIRLCLLCTCNSMEH